MSSASQTPEIPKTSLLSLPQETLARIFTHLDQPASLAISRVHPRFTELAQPGIWRSLNLQLHQRYGELVLVQPAAEPSEAYDIWARGTAEEAEKRHRAGIKAKVWTILRKADSRRLDWVRNITMMPRPGVTSGMLVLLDLVSASLTSLTILGPPHHPHAEAWRPEDYETLDVRFIDSGLYLPALTHLRIGESAARFEGFVGFLLRLTPNLISLDLFVPSDHLAEWYGPPRYPIGITPSSLLRLRVRTPALADHDGYSPLVFGLTPYIPRVQRIFIDFDGWDNAGMYGNQVALSGLSHLEEVIWPEARTNAFAELQDDVVLPALRRLLLPCDPWNTLTVCLPCIRMPTLETIYLHPSSVEIRSTTISSHIGPAQHMPPPFSFSLRLLPRLRTLQTLHTRLNLDTDDIFGQVDEAAREPANGTVNSYCHGGEEVLHATLLQQHWEVDDHWEREGERIEVLDLDTSVAYYSYWHEYHEGPYRVKVFRRSEEAAWLDFTDYKHAVVPLKVLEAMRNVEGKRKDEWIGRGIEVGPEASAVFEEWYEREGRQQLDHIDTYPGKTYDTNA